MRLKQSRLKTYHHRAAIPKKTAEGGSYTEYDAPVAFKAEEWAAGGKVQAERYGIRLPNIRNMRIEGNYSEVYTEDGKVGFKMEDGPTFSVDDGICLHVSAESKPDYKVIAVYPYRFLILEVERI